MAGAHADCRNTHPDIWWMKIDDVIVLYVLSIKVPSAYAVSNESVKCKVRVDECLLVVWFRNYYLVGLIARVSCIILYSGQIPCGRALDENVPSSARLETSQTLLEYVIYLGLWCLADKSSIQGLNPRLPSDLSSDQHDNVDACSCPRA